MKSKPGQKSITHDETWTALQIYKADGRLVSFSANSYEYGMDTQEHSSTCLRTILHERIPQSTIFLVKNNDESAINIVQQRGYHKHSESVGLIHVLHFRELS